MIYRKEGYNVPIPDRWTDAAADAYALGIRIALIGKSAAQEHEYIREAVFARERLTPFQLWASVHHPLISPLLPRSLVDELRKVCWERLQYDENVDDCFRRNAGKGLKWMMQHLAINSEKARARYNRMGLTYPKKRGHHVYSEEDDDSLRRMVSEGKTGTEIVERTGFTVKRVHCRVSRLGLRIARTERIHFSPEEDAKVKKLLVCGLSDREIAEELSKTGTKRTTGAVAIRRRKLKLLKRRQTKWTQEMYDHLVRFHDKPVGGLVVELNAMRKKGPEVTENKVFCLLYNLRKKGVVTQGRRT